jgi:hypothetical protein
MKIHPYLIARLYTIKEAFAHSGYYSPMPQANTAPVNNIPFDWNALLKDDDEGDSGGGGGTIKGLRGKNDLAGKAAMRRLGRK